MLTHKKFLATKNEAFLLLDYSHILALLNSNQQDCLHSLIIQYKTSNAESQYRYLVPLNIVKYSL